MEVTINESDQLEKNLKVSFKNPDLLREALTHRSFLNEARAAKINSNERLEFLGDAILAFWVSGQVFHLFPDYPEGKLTFIRTYLVRTETLTKLAQQLDLGKYLLMSKGEEQGGGRENQLLLANAFEAVLGAIYLDQGIEIAASYLKSLYRPIFSQISDIDQLKDSKSVLQETVQAEGHPSPTYRLIAAEGPDHQKTFTMGVYLEDKLLSQGTSRSKQEAEEEAAKKALEIISKIK